MDKQKNKTKDYHRFEEYTKEHQYDSKQQKVTVRFATMKAMLNAAWSIVDLYDYMDKNHLIYAGNPKQTLWFHPLTGHINLRDTMHFVDVNDKLEEQMEYSELTPPEVIRSNSGSYTRDGQNWSLAVLLFEFFYHSDGPYKGIACAMQPFTDSQEEYRWMAEYGVFNMDKKVHDNRPIPGVQDSLMKYWDIFPMVLQDAFMKTFVEGKENPENRLTALEWKKIINQLQTDYIECQCGYKNFIIKFGKNENGHWCCPKCKKIYYIFSNGENEIYLTTDTVIKRNQLYPVQSDNGENIGMVVENTRQKGLFGIKNISDEIWTGLYPDNVQKPIEPGGGIPIWQGLEITLPNGQQWAIQGDGNGK